MLRPEQMSKISVTGSKSVMSDVIEALHDLNLVHITDYDGSWDGFQPGDSLEGADETSSSLVTVRALENSLDLADEAAGPNSTADLTNAEDRLEEIRQEVNELDDRQDELRERRREIDEQLSQMELFADLGIDLDLLWGYDSLDVLVGEGDAEEITAELDDVEAVEAFEVFAGSETDAVAVFGYMTDDESLADALVGVSFTSVEVPETSGDPESNVAELEEERKQVEAELEKIENELETIRLNKGNFLLALEEELTIEAQKMEAPLRFATTDHSFIVEGWIPSDRYENLRATLEENIGDKIEIDELQRAAYTDSAGPHDEHEEAATDGGRDVSADEAGADDETAEVATDGGQNDGDHEDSAEVATDGGHDEGDVVTVSDDPPVVQRNSKIVNPFEILTRAVNQPKYSEFDPTIVLFLTFPLFFGFMIGDIGYGLAYILIGVWMYRKFDTESISNLGAIIVWMGLWTFLFGILYGEIFGLHFLEWFGIHPLIEKGIADTEWAISWLIIAVIAGWIHLNIGYLLNFFEEIQLHGAKEAVVETGSWLLMLNGIWLFIFSTLFPKSKPNFLVNPSNPSTVLLNEGPLGVGFAGFPEIVGIVGAGLFLLGVLILLTGPWYELFEFVVPLSHTLSYTRLTAVLLAKAGMALAANLLYWGAYQDEDGFHYMHEYNPGSDEIHGDVIFTGLSNMGSGVDIGPLYIGIEGALLGLPVLIIAHLVVLAVGGTAAIQAIRLEYFEFFEKFYEGGGKKYEPFGHERTHTTDN